jgi:hypothetical protein
LHRELQAAPGEKLKSQRLKLKIKAKAKAKG